MSSNIDSISESMIERRIEELKDVPARDPLQAASGRARFLRQAAEYRQAVSPGGRVRQIGWIFPIRKEKFAMTALVSLLLAFVLLLSGGATAAAAQNDLPDQPLYQLKLWTEDATLAMIADPQGQAERLMNMAQTRVEEIVALAEMGINPPDRVRERLEGHLRQTLVLAAGMDEADLEGTLLQLRDRLRRQDRLMQQLQTHASAETEPLLIRTRQMLQLHLGLVDQGLADPQGFRYMMKNRFQYGQDDTATPEPNQQGEPGLHYNGPTAHPTGGPGLGDGDHDSGNKEPGGNGPDGGSGDGTGSGTGGGNDDCGDCGGDGGHDDGGGSGGGGGHDDGGGSGGGGGNK